MDKITDKKDYSDMSEENFKEIATRIITKKGLKFLKKAVELGNPQAMCLLAECYLNGRGVKEDHDTAFEYYEQAANLGNQCAMMALGMMTLNEDDKHFDREKSQELFRKAMENDLNKKPRCYPVGNEILEYYRGERQF